MNKTLHFVSLINRLFIKRACNIASLFPASSITAVKKAGTIFIISLVCFTELSNAQTTPYKLEGNWQTGGWVNPIANLSARRGNTFMCRAQATAGASKQALFNNSASSYNPKWGRNSTADVTKNTRLSGGAIVNGSQDIYFVRTTGNYYTFVIGNAASVSNDLAILETTYNPTTFGSNPTQSPVAASVNAADAVTITVTLSAAPQVGENVYIRYSNDNFVSNFNVVQVTGFSGGVGTAVIPSGFNTGGTTVSYYPFSTPVSSPAAADADYLALRVQTQSGETGSIWSYTVSAGGPTLTTVAANTIGTITASSGGQTITSGSALSAKGVVWSKAGTSVNPTLATNDGSTNDGTAISDFTSSLTGLTAGTLYYVRAYATNGTTTGYGTANAFYTWSSPPSAQAASLTATVPTSVGFNHTWSAATFPGTGGYILLASTGTPSLSNGNGAAPTPSAGTIIVSSTISSGATSYTSTGLSANTTYNFVLIPYAWDGANAGTYNYLTAGAPTASNTTLNGTSLSGFTSITTGGVYTGETITINGTNLAGATAVSFNGTAAVSFTPGASSITATVALGTAASGNISVTVGGTPYTLAFNYLGYRTANDGDWSTAATWLGSILPSVANRTVTIANAVNVTTNLSGTQTGPLNILSGKSLVFGASGYLKIQTGNAFTNDGTLNMTAGGTFEFVGNANFTNNSVVTAGAGTIFFSGGVSTINGTAAITFYNLTLSSSLTITTSPITVNNNLQINGGNIVTASAINYTASSTLIYNTGYTVSNEWKANAVSGAGVPQNVQIGNGNNSAVNFGGSTAYYQLNGNMLVSPGSSLTLSSNNTSPGLKFAGNFTNNGTFAATGTNGRGLWFVGTSNQTMSSSTDLTLDYLLLNSGSDLKLSTSNFILNGNTNALQFLSSGGLDLNQRTLTLTSGATILLNAAGAKTISSTGGTGILALAGTHTLTATSGTLTTNSNVAITLAGGFTISAANALTVQGSLQINSGGFIATTNSPVYGTGSTLYYNSTNVYGVNNEWKAGAVSGAGVPSNVQIGNGAAGSALNLGAGAFTLTGNLTFSANTGAALTSSGTLNIGGNWINNTTNVANFNGATPVGTVVFNGSGAQSIGGLNINAGGYAFNSLTISNGSGISLGVTANKPLTIGTASTGTLTLTAGVLTTNTTNTVTIKNTAATATAGGATTSYVNGPLTWTLPASLAASGSVYNFPVGDAINSGGAYLPFSITTLTTGATGPVLQVQAVNTGSGGTADGVTLTAISNSEYWDVAVVSGNYTNGSVSLTRQAAMGALNVIGRAATKTAINYASLAGTVSGTSVNNSNTTGASLGFFVLGTTASVNITSNSPAAGTVLQGATSQIIHSIKLVATGVNSSLSGVTLTTGGTYTSGEFLNFTLWINSSNSLTGATQLGSTIITNVASGGTLTFTSGANLPYTLTTATGTYYLLVTSDVAPGATPNNYINIASTAFSNITFSGIVNKTGTNPVNASNNQTVFAWSITDFYVYVGGSGYYLNGSGGQGSSAFNGANVSTNNFYLNDVRLYTNRAPSQSICSGTVYYSIYPSSGSPSSWTALSLPNIIAGSSTGVSGTAEALQASSPNINVGCGLTNGGSYKLAVYWTFSGNPSASTCPGTADVYTLNNGGNYYTLTFTYTNSSYTPTFTTSPATGTCINSSVTYTTQTGRTNYTWSVPGVAGTDYDITAGGIGTSSNTVTLTWKTTGVKVVTVGYTNSGCVSATPASFTTTVAGIPTVSNAGTPLSTCVNTGVGLSANAPVTGTGAWTVSGPSNATSQFSNIADPAATFTPTGGAGTYTLTWTISSNPCTSSASSVNVTAIASGTWIGPTSNGDWNVPANWCGGVPTAATDVIIPAGNVIDIKTAHAFAHDITFASATAGIRMLNTYNLNIYGNLTTANGIFNATANTGKVYFVGNSTVSGAITFKNVAYSGGIDFGTQSTVTDTLVILTGGYSNINGPIYATGATLKYMTGGNYLRRVEWSQASGAGYPYDVWISNNTQLYAASAISLSANTILNTAGSLTIDNGAQLFMDDYNSGVPAIQSLNMNLSLIIAGSLNLKGNLSLSGTSGADIKVAKDWNFTAGGNFYQNGRAVFFNGNTLQTISRSAAGTLSFGITINNNSSGGLKLATGTNVNFTAAATDALQMLGTGTGNSFDLNTNTATLTGGGNIKIAGTPAINSTTGVGNFNITGGGNVNGTGALSFGSAVTFGLNGTFDFGANLSTINGILSVNSGGSVNTHAPFYGTGSVLLYNSTGNYNRNLEWSALSGAGYPYHVTVQNGTTFNLSANGGAAQACAGDLTVGSASTAGTLTMGSMTNTLTVGRDVNILGSPGTGTLVLSSAAGGHLYVGRSWNRTVPGVFTQNDRPVYFNGNSDGTITANGNGETFSLVYIDKGTTGSTITLLDSLTISKEIGFTKGKFDLAAKNVTLISNQTVTARVAEIATIGNVSLPYSGSGRFVIHRFYPSKRAWRLVTAPLDITTEAGPTINTAWQEGASPSVTGVSNANPHAPYGIHITGPNNNTGGPYSAAITASGFDQSPQNNSSMKYFTGGLSGVWAPIANTMSNKITDKQGYLLFVRGSRAYNISVTTNYSTPSNAILRSKGKIKIGQVSVPVGPGFQLIGNPYPSAIKFGLNTISNNTSVLASNSYSIWDPLKGSMKSSPTNIGGWVQVTCLTPSGLYFSNYDPNTIDPGIEDSIHALDVTGEIQSGAAFMIETKPATDSLVDRFKINESDKLAGSNNYLFRPMTPLTDPMPTLRVNMYALDGNNDPAYWADGTLDLFDNSFNNNLDWSEDVRKLASSTENLSIRREGELIAIEQRQPVSIVDTIFYNITNMKLGRYRFDFIATDWNRPGLVGFIEDSYTGIRTPFNTNGVTTVPFIITPAPGTWIANRFRLVFGPEGGPLPVTYTSVKAWQQNRDIAVEWKVENELNIDEYQVEKSTDGRNFTKVNATAAKGNNNTSVVYNWLDANPVNGTNYYRIRSVEYNRSGKYSQVVKVVIGKGISSVAVYPNPVKGNVVALQLTNMPKGNYEVRLINNLGQVLRSKTIQHAGGSATETMPLNITDPSGTYHLEVLNPDGGRTLLQLLR